MTLLLRVVSSRPFGFIVENFFLRNVTSCLCVEQLRPFGVDVENLCLKDMTLLPAC